MNVGRDDAGHRHNPPAPRHQPGTAGALEPLLKVYDIVVGEGTQDYGAFRSVGMPTRAGAGVSQSRWTPTSHWLEAGVAERGVRSSSGDRPAIAAVLVTRLGGGG